MHFNGKIAVQTFETFHLEVDSKGKRIEFITLKKNKLNKLGLFYFSNYVFYWELHYKLLRIDVVFKRYLCSTQLFVSWFSHPCFSLKVQENSWCVNMSLYGTISFFFPSSDINFSKEKKIVKSQPNITLSINVLKEIYSTWKYWALTFY